jgi:hypothetical protein
MTTTQPIEGHTPWSVERHDDDDGSINYEIWDRKLYERIVTLNDFYDSKNSRKYAKLIVEAVNFYKSQELADLRERAKAAPASAEWHRIDDPENPPPKDGTKIIVASRFQSEIDLMWLTRWEYIAEFYLDSWAIKSDGLAFVRGGHAMLALDGVTHYRLIQPPKDA